MSHHLGDGQILKLAGGLQHDADPGTPALVGALRVYAEHTHRAGVAAPVPLQDLDRGALARSVRSEQREDLASAYLQVKAVHGDVSRIFLTQSLHGDRKLVSHAFNYAGSVPDAGDPGPGSPARCPRCGYAVCAVFHLPK